MRLSSPAWANGEPIPERFARAGLHADGHVVPAENLSPPLVWTGVPREARSLALICQDFDALAPSDGLRRVGGEWPVDAPRMDVFHWVLIDLPASVVGLTEGPCSPLFAEGADPSRADWHGVRCGAHEVRGGAAGVAAPASGAGGYDGPCPPADDALVHHIVFTLYALSVPRLALEGRFVGTQALQAMVGHVLASATHSGTYTLNRRLRQASP